jgi:hypothetical protein
MEVVSVAGKEISITDIPDRSIDYTTYVTIRANSEGFRALLPKLTNEALQYVFTYNFEPNASYRKHGATYNDMLIGSFIPELLNRLKSK